MNEKAAILLVSTNPRNLELLAQFLEKEGYRPLPAASLDEFNHVLATAERIDLALVDLAGFDRRIWDDCERLRDKNIPLLVVSPRQSSTLQQESLAHGARGILVKPLVVHELLGLVGSLLEA